jgi:hypothetical protein
MSCTSLNNNHFINTKHTSTPEQQIYEQSNNSATYNCFCVTPLGNAVACFPTSWMQNNSLTTKFLVSYCCPNLIKTECLNHFY